MVCVTVYNRWQFVCLALFLSSATGTQGQVGLEKNVTVKNDLHFELTQRLFANRTVFVPPYTYNTDGTYNPVSITIHTFIYAISGLDLKNQQLTFQSWFIVTFTDVSASWNTTVYPVDAIFVQPDSMWRPYIYLPNSVLPYDQLAKVETLMTVYSDGLVRWSPGDTMITTCAVDITLFPFDTQVCDIEVRSWSYRKHQVNCTHADLFGSIRSNEWEVTNTSQSIQYGRWWKVIYTLTLQRKWLFYAMNVLLPVLLVSVLNSVVFVLPVECGEKMAVSLTTFLTLAVFMTLIQDSLPSNSDTVCYLAVYLATQMILSVLAVAVSAVRVACHHRRQTTAENSTLHVQPNVAIHDGGTVAGLSDKGGEVAADICNSSSNNKTDWRRVGVVIDRICLPVFAVLGVSSFVLYCAFIILQGNKPTVA